jgi:hypothetical protein
VQLWSICTQIVFFQATEYRIDVTFKNSLARVHTQFFAKLLVVSAAESGHWCVKNTAKLSSWIVVVKDVSCWEVLIFSNAIDAFNYVDSIFIAIE